MCRDEAHTGRADNEGLPRECNERQVQPLSALSQPASTPPSVFSSRQAGAGLHHEEPDREQHDERGRGPQGGQGDARRSVGLLNAFQRYTSKRTVEQVFQRGETWKG